MGQALGYVLQAHLQALGQLLAQALVLSYTYAGSFTSSTSKVLEIQNEINYVHESKFRGAVGVNGSSDTNIFSVFTKSPTRMAVSL